MYCHKLSRPLIINYSCVCARYGLDELFSEVCLVCYVILCTLGPPNPPTVLITNIYTTTISLSWSSGFTGYSPLANVIISYNSSNYISEGTQILSLPAVYSTILTGLHPNTNYSIQIALINVAGFNSSPTTVTASTVPISKCLPNLVDS